MMRQVMVSALTATVLIGAATFVVWANDVRQDRKHTVMVDEPTALFAGGGRSCDTRLQIATVQRGEVLPVRRIRYWKNCATIDVNAPDGRLSHFILGAGVDVKPPLQ